MKEKVQKENTYIEEQERSRDPRSEFCSINAMSLIEALQFVVTAES